MEHSIALVTGATSGLGQAAARLLAGEGWHEIIVTGRSLAGARQAAAQLAAENKTVIFTPLAAGSGQAVQRSVRPCRARQERSADRFPAAQCRDGPEVRSACSLRRASRRLRPR